MSQNSADNGYKEEDWLSRFLLVVTHVILLPSLITTYNARRALPFAAIAVGGCLLASTSYHLCANLGICVFQDHRIHRHLDHYFSLMLAVYLVLMYMWVPEARPLKVQPPKNPPLGQLAQGSMADSIMTAPERFWENVKDSELSAGSTPWLSIPAKGIAIRFRRPVHMPHFILFLYFGNAYLHFFFGWDSYGTKAMLIFAFVCMVVSVLTFSMITGLRIRVYMAVVILTLLALAYLAFCLDRILGAMGHNAWHILIFIGIHIYIHEGPIFVNQDGYCMRVGPSYTDALMLAMRNRDCLPSVAAPATPPQTTIFTPPPTSVN